MIRQLQLIQDSRVFRPAGYHRPAKGELYVSVGGRVVKKYDDNEVDGERLIVRCASCQELGCVGRC